MVYVNISADAVITLLSQPVSGYNMSVMLHHGRGTIDEVEEIVAKARMWRWKPYGEVTLRFAQDGQGRAIGRHPAASAVGPILLSVPYYLIMLLAAKCILSNCSCMSGG